ncbi:MAG: elongation factor G [Planctomycetes bacterium]|nr:elongation factor G [Planctomycetota bacterium]
MLDPATIRNIGIVAHIDAGKTTTTERILYYTGRTHRMGQVDHGTTVTDFDEQEQKRGITIYSAAVSCPWRGFTINLIDTPGHVDFTAEVERSLRVLDGMVAVFDAKEGVEAQSETVWAQADKYRVPRICFINKMDKIGADFEWSVASIRKRLRVEPLVLQLPIGSSDSLTGIIDLVEMKAVYPRDSGSGTLDVRDIPDELLGAAERARGEMIEALSETSEALMERYLGDQTIGLEEIRHAIRGATLRHELVPVLCGSALKNIGVQRMLDAVCDYLPGPLDVPPITAADAKRPDVQHEIACDRDGPLAALVFKIVAEKPVDLCYLRLYSGTLKPHSRLLNPITGEKENITRIVRMFAKRREQLDRASAGDIVAVVGPKSVLTGHTLCDPRRPVVLESIEFPETVISISVRPKSSKDRDKFHVGLTALQRQDPTLRVATNVETGQTLLSGMGELHLEVMVQRLRDDMNVDVAVGNPRVSYRETVTTRAEGEGRFLKNLGGREHLAAVRVRIEPRQRVSGRLNYEVTSSIAPGTLPEALLESMEAGIVEAAQSGVLGGYPVIDWEITLLEAEFDQEKSSELAFENAARAAFYDAMRHGDAVLLQPIMDVSVVTTDEHFGTIVSDLNARNAVVRETQVRGHDRVILADVPLAQMFGYITKLRSLSQGRATSMMTPSHYAPMPAAEMKALVG